MHLTKIKVGNDVSLGSHATSPSVIPPVTLFSTNLLNNASKIRIVNAVRLGSLATSPSVILPVTLFSTNLLNNASKIRIVNDVRLGSQAASPSVIPPVTLFSTNLLNASKPRFVLTNSQPLIIRATNGSATSGTAHAGEHLKVLTGNGK